jgi:hypothetical protein
VGRGDDIGDVYHGLSDAGFVVSRVLPSGGLAARARLRYPDRAVRSSPLAPLAVLLALASSGCDERADAAQPDAALPPPSAAPPPSLPAVPAPSAAPAPSSSAGGEAASLQLLKLVFTTDVKNKDPVDKLDHAQPGQRVWVHLTMRNRGAEARPITLSFRVNGDQRTNVDLKIEPSWSYRTWGYSTLRGTDVAGELTVDVRDAAGALVTSARLPIKADRGKPEASKPAKPPPAPLDE